MVASVSVQSGVVLWVVPLLVSSLLLLVPLPLRVLLRGLDVVCPASARRDEDPSSLRCIYEHALIERRADAVKIERT